MKRSLSAATIVLSLCLIMSGSASADSISTGVADWQLTALPAGAPGTIGPAVVIAPHPAWNHSLEAAADWIGATEDGNATGLAGDYVYELSLQLPAGSYALNAAFTSDNMVSSFKLNGNELLAAPQTDVYSYKGTFNVSGTASGSPVVLSVVVHNSDYGVGQSLANPTGLIVAGDLVAVPLPSAAYAGISLLGVLGAMKVVRRRIA